MNAGEHEKTRKKVTVKKKDINFGLECNSFHFYCIALLYSMEKIWATKRRKRKIYLLKLKRWFVYVLLGVAVVLRSGQHRTGKIIIIYFAKILL